MTTNTTRTDTGAPGTTNGQSEDPVVEANRRLLLERSQVGLKKYGTSLAASRLSTVQFARHALEEALDMANYLQAIIQSAQPSPATGGEHAPERSETPATGRDDIGWKMANWLFGLSVSELTPDSWRKTCGELSAAWNAAAPSNPRAWQSPVAAPELDVEAERRALSIEDILHIVAENTGPRINLSNGDLDLYIAVVRKAIAADRAARRAAPSPVSAEQPESPLLQGRYRVKLRRGPGFKVKPEAEQIDGWQGEFMPLWPNEDDELYPGEWAMAPAPDQGWPDSAPVWIATGDLEEVSTEQAAGAPGWQMVPQEPTDAMMDAAEGCSKDWPRTTWKAAWSAMLQAAPSPDSPVGAKEQDK